MWDSSLDELKSHRTCPGGHGVEIPTKTPLDLGQLAGSGTSSDRQFHHVESTHFTGSAFFSNLEVSVRKWSIVRRLLMVFPSSGYLVDRGGLVTRTFYRTPLVPVGLEIPPKRRRQ